MSNNTKQCVFGSNISLCVNCFLENLLITYLNLSRLVSVISLSLRLSSRTKGKKRKVL